MLVGFSSNVSNMYLSPRLAMSLCLNCECGRREKFFFQISIKLDKFEVSVR